MALIDRSYYCEHFDIPYTIFCAIIVCIKFAKVHFNFCLLFCFSFSGKLTVRNRTNTRAAPRAHSRVFPMARPRSAARARGRGVGTQGVRTRPSTATINRWRYDLTAPALTTATSHYRGNNGDTAAASKAVDLGVDTGHGRESEGDRETRLLTLDAFGCSEGHGEARHRRH